MWSWVTNCKLRDDPTYLEEFQDNVSLHTFIKYLIVDTTTADQYRIFYVDALWPVYDSQQAYIQDVATACCSTDLLCT